MVLVLKYAGNKHFVTTFGMQAFFQRTLFHYFNAMIFKMKLCFHRPVLPPELYACTDEQLCPPT